DCNAAAKAPCTLGETDDSDEIALLARAQAAVYIRASLGPAALEPLLGIMGCTVAPEQPVGPAARFPLLGRRAQPRQELCSLLASMEPLPELLPRVDQGLGDGLHRRALAVAAGFDEQEPSRGELLHDLFDGIGAFAAARAGFIRIGALVDLA